MRGEKFLGVLVVLTFLTLFVPVLTFLGFEGYHLSFHDHETPTAEYTKLAERLSWSRGEDNLMSTVMGDQALVLHYARRELGREYWSDKVGETLLESLPFAVLATALMIVFTALCSFIINRSESEEVVVYLRVDQ